MYTAVDYDKATLITVSRPRDHPPTHPHPPHATPTPTDTNTTCDFHTRHITRPVIFLLCRSVIFCVPADVGGSFDVRLVRVWCTSGVLRTAMRLPSQQQQHRTTLEQYDRHSGTLSPDDPHPPLHTSLLCTLLSSSSSVSTISSFFFVSFSIPSVPCELLKLTHVVLSSLLLSAARQHADAPTRLRATHHTSHSLPAAVHRLSGSLSRHIDCIHRDLSFDGIVIPAAFANVHLSSDHQTPSTSPSCHRP